MELALIPNKGKPTGFIFVNNQSRLPYYIEEREMRRSFELRQEIYEHLQDWNIIPIDQEAFKDKELRDKLLK